MEFDKEKYKVYTWKNWMMFHWIINPGLAFNELVLGQRIPKVTLEDKISNKPRVERSIVPCPHCETLHDGRIWSAHNKTAFKNWFGYYCPTCGGIIPCLMNAFSWLILAITYPIWGWFRKSLKEAWLQQQPARFENIDVTSIPNPFEKKGWIYTGLSFGAVMFVIMSLLMPFFFDEEITLETLAVGLVAWTLGGLGFGFFMKLFLGKSPKTSAE
jgi:hypothetical protein